jgi:dephospho-CoA kinase
VTARIVVALSGQVSAGKTTAGYFLRDQGLGYTRISWAIKEHLASLARPMNAGDEPSRRQYQNDGIDLHNELGQAWLCRQALRLLPPYVFHFVVDGLRWVDDVEFFRRRYGPQLVHFHIEAPQALRRKRFELRDKDVSFAEADNHEVEREAPLLGPLADRIIVNDSSLDDFYASVSALLEEELYAR